MTTYTNSLKLGKPAVGATGWGSLLNAQLIDMVEEAVAGFATVEFTGAGGATSVSLTQSNGTTNASRCAALRLIKTGGPDPQHLVLLNMTKVYIITNDTGVTITACVASTGNASTGIAIPAGTTTTIYTDGTTTVKSGTSFLASLQFASLRGTGSTTVTTILDEDSLTSDSATALATQQSIKAYIDNHNVASFEFQMLPVSPDSSGLKQSIANGATATAFQFDVVHRNLNSVNSTSTQLDLSLRYDMFTAGTAASINRAVANMRIFRKALSPGVRKTFDFGTIATTGTKIGSVTTDKKKLQVTGDVTEFLDSSSYIATDSSGSNKARVFSYNYDQSSNRTNIYYVSADTSTTDSVFTTSAGCHANPHGWAALNDEVEMFPLQSGTSHGAFKLDEIILAGTDASTGIKTIKFPAIHLVRGYRYSSAEELIIKFEGGPDATDGGINVYTLGVLQTLIPGVH